MRPLALLFMLAACSDYNLEQKVDDERNIGEDEPPGESAEEDDEPGPSSDTGDTGDSGDADIPEDCNGVDDNGDGRIDEGYPDTDADGTADCVDTEECDGLDNNGDGEIDEGFDTNNNGLPDCTEEEAYCTDFSTFEDWSYNGSGSWRIESGMLTEGRAGTYEAIAWTGDMGSAARFTVEVDIAWTGSANDFAGIAWAVSGTDALVVRWDDPQGYYSRYSTTGAIDIAFCSGGLCTPYIAESAADLYHPADQTFATLAVAVDHDQVDVLVDGTSVLTATVPEVDGTGPGVVGVYSDDNDGGVWFDNYCVWVEGS